MTKIIGIDLDEVLSETIDKILLDNGNKLGKAIVSREDIVDYHIYKNEELGLTMEEGNKYFHRVYIEDVNLEMKIVEGAKQKIQEFLDKGYSLKLITARPIDVEEETKNWLEKHFPASFDSVHFTNHFTFVGEEKKPIKKSEICRELGVCSMVEDNFDYALELAQNGIFTYLLEKPWNKYINKEHELIKKVKSWSEVDL